MRRNLLLTIDEFVKTPQRRHSGESRNPELIENTGFPRIAVRGRLQVKHGMTKTLGMILSGIMLLSLVLSAKVPAAEGPGLKPTLFSMDFYGSIASANPGDSVTVYDEKGTLCGQFTINQEGQYGFLHVYGDDKTTAVHEGADVNGRLTFLLNGVPLVPLSGQELLWLGDGQQIRVDFVRR